MTTDGAKDHGLRKRERFRPDGRIVKAYQKSQIPGADHSSRMDQAVVHKGGPLLAHNTNLILIRSFTVLLQAGHGADTCRRGRLMLTFEVISGSRPTTIADNLR